MPRDRAADETQPAVLPTPLAMRPATPAAVDGGRVVRAVECRPVGNPVREEVDACRVLADSSKPPERSQVGTSVEAVAAASTGAADVVHHEGVPDPVTA